jgi:hypothetical protein
MLSFFIGNSLYDELVFFPHQDIPLSPFRQSKLDRALWGCTPCIPAFHMKSNILLALFHSAYVWIKYGTAIVITKKRVKLTNFYYLIGTVKDNTLWHFRFLCLIYRPLMRVQAVDKLSKAQ